MSLWGSAWWLFQTATAPTPPLLKKASRVLEDVKAGAGLLNDFLPEPDDKDPSPPTDDDS